MRTLVLIITSATMLFACASRESYDPLKDYEEVPASSNLDMPTPVGVTADKQASVAQGEYLVELLGCGSCHTDGALVGKPDMSRLLAGSRVGIAYTNPLENKNPGVVYPRNLTPDRDTGIGLWTDQQIADAVRSGAGRHGFRRFLVMPWQRYAKLNDEDLAAIVDYLRNLDPVTHQLPAAVPAGRRAQNPYVHFGVYQSRN